MRAVFKLEDEDGSCTSTPGVVDSGAAFNALQPGRGMTDRVPVPAPEAMLARLESESSAPREMVYALDRLGDHIQACANPPASADWSQYVEVFTRTFCRGPSVDAVLPAVDTALRSPPSDALARELTCAGFDVHPISSADPPTSDLGLDVFCRDHRAYLCMTDGSAPSLVHAADLRTARGLTSVSSNVPLRALDRPLPPGRFAPQSGMVVAANQLVALLLQEELGVPALPRAEHSYMLSTAMDPWARHGYLQRGLHERQLCAVEDDPTSPGGEGSPDGEGGPDSPPPPPEPREEVPPPRADVDYHPCLADQRRDAGLRVGIETLLNSRRQRNATRRLYEDDWEIKGDTLHCLSTNDSGEVIFLIAIPEHPAPAVSVHPDVGAPLVTPPLRPLIPWLMIQSPWSEAGQPDFPERLTSRRPWVYLPDDSLSETPMSPTHWRHLSQSLMRLCQRSISQDRRILVRLRSGLEVSLSGRWLGEGVGSGQLSLALLRLSRVR